MRRERRLPSRKSYKRLFAHELSVMMVVIVIFAAFFAFAIAVMLGNVFFGDVDVYVKLIFNFAIKELLMPISTVLIGSVIIGIIVPRVTKVITVLNEATQKIAKGDYSYRIPTDAMLRSDEIGSLAVNFNLMAKELESNEMLKKDFIGNISHEFKTPLSIIQGYARLLEQDDLPDDQRRRYARLIAEESGRLADLSSNMLKLSRLENQKFIVSPKPIALDEQILQSILRLQPKWEKKNIEFDTDIVETRVTGDEELLSQVWLNIVDNAIKYSPNGGLIRVTMEKENGVVSVTIADEGVGMSEETRRRAFERYYTQDEKNGNGLGLSIVSRIVELHSGTVDIESEPGKGAAFIVRLRADE